MTITREDLTVETATTDWGGPMATVTVRSESDRFVDRQFVLKSTEGMPALGINGGDGIHVFENPGEHWHGVLHTKAMEPGLTELAEYLDSLERRSNANYAVPLVDLRDALSDFDDSLVDTSRRDFVEEWERVKAAVVAVDMALRPFVDGREG